MDWRAKLYESTTVDPEAYAQHWIQRIKAECGPWLKASAGHNVYRGIHTDPLGSGVIERPVRTDRYPRDSGDDLHAELSKLIDSAGCIANRHNSMFVTGSERFAQGYGASHVVYPIGSFDFTWSPHLADAWNDLTGGDSEEVGNPELIHTKDLYQCDVGSLLRAIQSNHEIMIACKSAIYVPSIYFYDLDQYDEVEYAGCTEAFGEIIKGVRS